jgi:hypothetical protein
MHLRYPLAAGAQRRLAAMNPASVEELPPATEELSLAPAPIFPVEPGHRGRVAAAIREYRLGATVYLGSLALLFCIALINGALRHVSLTGQLKNWDGRWYYWVAASGYPHHVVHAQTQLGFMPLYPLSMRAVSSVFGCSLIVAGVILSAVGGFIAAILVQRLAIGWWGEESGRRAVVLFCVFPGAVVFSMMYSEGLLLPLAAGCILALERRRWVLAGVLAGIATAVEPDALALVLVCAVSAILELRRRGFRDRQARRSLLAPLLAPVGALAFAGYLWAWTGTPFATYITQHYGWSERTDPLALLNLVEVLVSHISLSHFNQPTIDLNLVVGLIGAVVLIAGLTLLLRKPRLVSPEALTWTLAISFLAVTSEYVPPNPRLLITAFPVICVFAHRIRGRGYAALIATNVVVLAGLSALTYIGVTVRP